MVDPVTVMTAGTIVQLAFQVFLSLEDGKANGGKVSKLLTEEGLTQIGELRQKIWRRLRYKSKRMQELEMTIASVQRVTPEQIHTIAVYLQMEMSHDRQFAAEIRQMAHKIMLMQAEDHSDKDHKHHEEVVF